MGKGYLGGNELIHIEDKFRTAEMHGWDVERKHGRSVDIELEQEQLGWGSLHRGACRGLKEIGRAVEDVADGTAATFELTAEVATIVEGGFIVKRVATKAVKRAGTRALTREAAEAAEAETATAARQASRRTMTVREGRFTLETGAKLSADETAVAKTFTRHGYDVRGRVTASEQGIEYVRTSDLWVSGLGPVEVYTPKNISVATIARGVASKGGQAPIIVVRGNVPDTMMRRIALHVWGKTESGAKLVQTIVFENSGDLTWFTRVE